MIELKQMIIPAGQNNRPATNSWRKWYKLSRPPHYITAHNPFWAGDAKSLAEYQLSSSCASRPASWHLNIDAIEAWQSLPFDEPAFHAGDNLGPGNRDTIGEEICDQDMLHLVNGSWQYKSFDDPAFEEYLKSERHAAKVNAYLIKTLPSLEPFPDCLHGLPKSQHNDWSGKNCPWLMRNRPNGWRDFLDMVQSFLDEEEQPDLKHRVIVGSFTNKENAITHMGKLRLAAPTVYPFIVWNKAGEKLLYRVVAAEHDRLDHAEVLSDSLKRKGFDNFIISADDFGDLEMQPDLPPPDYDPPDNPDEYEQPEIPSGLLEILKALFDWLKKLFGEE
jgi:N-acetylmuramoyl-L-alanine amidase